METVIGFMSSQIDVRKIKSIAQPCPSISFKLLDSALNFASKYSTIPKEEKDIIKHTTIFILQSEKV